ncbi:phage tail protein [Luteibacter yeojuensis]|uniref:Phage tail protein n=1 Tax=Luteibacter yeojuensis TaxID=345309 RepID=A0A7X5TPF3_9GAMM|nr:phage tail protein [Luteibacter yeojuensis]NID14402.1 phage tail protein [Luteibacter yeojuensis]
MTDTFTWPTQARNTGTETGSVRESRFGGGYRQVVANGINPLARSWPIRWSGPKDTALAIRDFLRAHIGVPFYWTAPGDTQQLYTCVTWSPNDEGGNVYTITATFEQFNSP